MKRIGFFFLICSVQLLNMSAAFSQQNSREIGLPYFVNYDEDVYGARYDNWGALQGSNGFMYFCNGFGLLEYDGAHWRLIKLPENGFPRSLAMDTNGKIYVGADADIGYLKADSLGRMQFFSLKPLLPAEERDLGIVWKTYCIDDSVFFHTREVLIRIINGKSTIWKASDRGFFMSHKPGKTLFIEDQQKGVLQLKGDSLQAVTGEGFPARGYLNMLDFRGRLLLSTVNQGLFLEQSDGSFLPFRHEAEAYLKEYLPYCIEKLENEWLAIGTRGGGLVILDQEGHLICILNEENGLGDNFITALANDDQGGLWATHTNGLSRIEVPSAFSVFNAELGVEGAVDHLVRFQDSLYVAERFGLLVLRNNRFERLDGISFYANHLLALEDELLVASKGTYSYKDGSFRQLNDFGSHYLQPSKLFPNLIFVGLADGLAYLKKEGNHWVDGGRIENIKDDIRNIVETPSGDLWLESQYRGIWRVVLDPKNLNRPKKVKHFLPGKDIPEGLLFLTEIEQEPISEIEGVAYRYHEKLDSLLPDPDYGKRFGLEYGIAPKTVDRHGNVWMYAQMEAGEEKKQRTVSILQKDGSYRLKVINDHRVEGVVRKVLYPEDNGIAWYAGADGIVRHDLNQQSKMPKVFKAFVRNVFVGKDSLIFGGVADNYSAPSIDFAHNSMRFEFAAPSYTRSEDNLYQYQLVGFDKSWSEWTSETRTDYTNLPEGKYTFKARAKNIYRQISEAGSFEFVVLPPWYRSWWAYGIYAFLGALLIYGIIRWRLRQLTLEKRKLEQLVDQKTAEVKKQAEQLKELDKAKSRFFANISHEFRTPLTLILGPLENQLKKDAPLSKSELNTMHRNARRLERLIQQLLDLSKIESGNLQLQLQDGDIVAFLKALTASFSSHAEQRNIQYTLDFHEESLESAFDPDKVEKIVYNILSNAFKFTPDGGQVAVKVINEDDQLIFSVKDSGAGIPADELPHIFDRFYRSADAQKNEREGTGIGLALSRELAKLHGGQILASSKPGLGSTFTVELPVLAAANSGDRRSHLSRPSLSQLEAAEKGLENTESPFTAQKDQPILLIVEDNEDLRQYISRILSPQYNILEAIDGRHGMDVATREVPDLIISDLMMPHMDGIELCSQLKSHEATSHIPVILLTAKANRESKLEGLSTGADDYLIKPFNAEELRVRVKNLIDQRKLLQQRFSRTVILKPADIAINSMDVAFLEKVMLVIEKNMDNADFTTEDFQKEMTMSRMQLHRKLKALTGHATTEFVRIQRLKRAATLLEKDSASVSEICYQVGFNSLSYFTKMFREQFGVPPSQYKR